mmetsp:Transcript_56096/g.149667  ORF Transcript_56096/g.149667 Transcript_56096/m.149667 type:complete len:208 (+) Transcript_56096:1376-1999(+)
MLERLFHGCSRLNLASNDALHKVPTDWRQVRRALFVEDWTSLGDAAQEPCLPLSRCSPRICRREARRTLFQSFLDERPADDTLHDRAASAPHVHSHRLCSPVVLQHFRWHRLPCPSQRSRAVGEPGTPPKVSDLHVAVQRKQQIFELDVSVDETHMMDVGEAAEKLCRPRGSVRFSGNSTRHLLHVMQKVGLAHFHAQENAARDFLR